MKKVDQPAHQPETQPVRQQPPAPDELSRRNTLTTLAETGSLNSQLTVIVADDDMNAEAELDAPSRHAEAEIVADSVDTTATPNLTSTPNSRNHEPASTVDAAERPPLSNGPSQSGVNTQIKSSVASEHKKHMLSSLNRPCLGENSDTHEAEYDDETNQETNENETNDIEQLNKSNGRISFGNVSLNNSPVAKSSAAGAERKRSLTRRRLYSAGKIVLVFFFILFVCLLIEFLVCKWQRYNDSAYSCTGQIMNTMRNRVSTYSQANNRWVSWVNVDSRCQLIDPIFAWFFSKHRSTN